MGEVQSEELVEKLKDNFDEMVVYKDLKKSNFISSFKLPSFMRDWVLKRFQDEDGIIDVDVATEFIRIFIPKKEDWKSIKNRIVNYCILQSPADSDAFQSGRCAKHNGRPETMYF